MTTLPGPRVVHEKKVAAYLLNPHHSEGSSKARFFIAAGFGTLSSPTLREALLVHPEMNQVIATEMTGYGLKSIVRCRLETPDGQNPCITSVWIAEPGSDVQRLVTAYPGS